MSGKSHQSLIKTPKQLVIVLALSFVVPIIVIVLLAQLATSGRIYDEDAKSPEAVAKRIKPVADVVVAESAGARAALKAGEEVYKSVCMACHATGVNKAPKFGDRRDWAPRIREGQKELVRVALKGEGAMPPKGGASELSDVEVERAVVYMVNAAGGKFREPALPGSAVHAGAKADGRKVYESTCMACHGAGVANAPKFGDKKAWATHLMHGTEHVYENALKGKGAMPPKGGNLTLSEAEVKAAVDYMLGAVK
jgi:cytochrome c5